VILERKRRFYNRYCKELAIKARAYRQQNREKLIEYGRNYYKANRVRLLAQQREWRKLFGVYNEKCAERNRAYYWANIEKIKDRKCVYRETHKQSIAAQKQRWRENNRSKHREACRRRNAMKRAGRLRALVHPTRSAIDARFAIWRNRCAFCGVDASHPRNAGHERLTEEHVLALSRHGIDCASNIAPACLTCNCSKHARPVEDWYRRQPFFTEARWRKIQRHCPAAVVGQLPLAFAA
jgi:hypothetical protein